MAQYGAKSQYWDDRYARDPEPFDWYQRWEGLKDVLKEVIEPTHSILMLGCGNSRLSEELYDDGYTNIDNIDISGVVIAAMNTKYQDKTMKFVQMDAGAMEYPKDHFNVVLDKGTLDSILCGEGSSQTATKVLSEVTRVLKPNGAYICISHGEPSYRLTFLHRPEHGWNVTVKTVVKPMTVVDPCWRNRMGLRFPGLSDANLKLMGMASTATTEDVSNVHYIYVCTKGEPIAEKSDVWEEATQMKAADEDNDVPATEEGENMDA